MKIAFLGGGAVAKSIAALATIVGHETVLGLRNPDVKNVEFLQTSFEQAVTDADVVIVALPYPAAGQVLPTLAEALSGKIVVDATNPVASDWSPILTGEQSSGAEHLQRLLPNSRLVKAFNTIFADTVRPDRLIRSGLRTSMFVAGDDVVAVRAVMGFGETIGFGAVNAGPLKSARYLEAIAHLNIELAIGQGGGTNAAIIYERATSAL